MKHFMLPRNPLRDAAELPSSPSPTPTTSSAKPRSSSRKHKPSKENDPPSDPNLVTPSPAKLKSPLPPRPPSSNPLKRKLTAADALTDNSLPAPSDSGVKVMLSSPIRVFNSICRSSQSPFWLLAFFVGYCQDEAAVSGQGQCRSHSSEGFQ